MDKVYKLKKEIEVCAKDLGQISIMEVCGTHTASIRKYGIGSLLPDNIRLVSGPGCPVCVTAQEDIASALCIAKKKDTIFTCFGDMMRVPCSGVSLYSLYESGRDIRIVTSPMDALYIARENPGKRVVYFAIGFETTAPLTAALIEAANEAGILNLSVLSAHKTMPNAIGALLSDENKIDALICPGHVAAILGCGAFEDILKRVGLPGAVSGFGAYDIMLGLFYIVSMLKNKEKRCINAYRRAVKHEGNKEALDLLYKFFKPCDALWRGLGEISASGLKIKDEYSKFDALKNFNIETTEAKEEKGCICAEILRGKKLPTQCVNFGVACTPQNPLGACMVSFEGCCAAYYRY